MNVVQTLMYYSINEHNAARIAQQKLEALASMQAMSRVLDTHKVIYEMAVCGGAANDWMALQPARDMDIVLCFPAGLPTPEILTEMASAAQLTNMEQKAQYADAVCYMHRMTGVGAVQLIISEGLTLEQRMASFPCSVSMVCARPTSQAGVWIVHCLPLWQVGKKSNLLFFGGERNMPCYREKMQCKYPSWRAVTVPMAHRDWLNFAQLL